MPTHAYVDARAHTYSQIITIRQNKVFQALNYAVRVYMCAYVAIDFVIIHENYKSCLTMIQPKMSQESYPLSRNHTLNFEFSLFQVRGPSSTILCSCV